MMYSLTSLPEDLMGPAHFTALDAHLNYYFKASDPREVLQERSNLATYGNREVKSLVEHFRNDYLTEEEETSLISMWPALRTRLVRQKAITQIMYSLALTSFLQDLMTSSPAYIYWTSRSPQLPQQQSVSQVSLQ